MSAGGRAVDKASMIWIAVALLFLVGLYMAAAARIEVDRLRSRLTEVEDKVRQMEAFVDNIARPTGGAGGPEAG